MKTDRMVLTSRADGLKLGVTVAAPAGAVRGIVQISHGMAEHRERYLPFQQYLAERGWASVIHDHRGHGESVKSKEDLGYFYKRGAENVVRDLRQVTGYIRAGFPKVPLVLFGHSMGSMIVRVYCKQFDRDLDGLVVCGSPSKNVFAGLAQRGLGLVSGGRRRIAAVQKLAFGGFAKKFGGEPERGENRWICSDPEVVRAYDADELCGFTFTENGFYHLFKLMRQCYSSSGWGVRNPGMPIFFIAGAEDPCIIDEAHFNRAVGFLRDRGYREVSAKLYPGLRHEILNEPSREEVMADVLAFAEGVRARRETGS